MICIEIKSPDGYELKRRQYSIREMFARDVKNTYPYPAMHFHHRDGEMKDVSWTKLRLRSWDKIVLELDKCDLVCANCHAIIHSLIED